MRHEIESAPTRGEFILLEDDASGKYAVARWSAEAGDWVEENGKPIQITATHWYPMPSDKYLLQEDCESSGPYPIERPASWARRRNLFPFSLSRAAPRQPTASDAPAFPSVVNAAQNDAIEAQTIPVGTKHLALRRRLATLSIIATLVVVALIGMSFGIPDGPAIVQRFASPKQVAQQSVAREGVLLLRTDADQTAARAWPAAETTAPAQPPLERGPHPEPLSDELAKAQRTIDERNLQLRELANELAIARREIDALNRLASRVSDQTQQAKRAAESAVELRQSLQQEREKAAALAQDLATARKEIDAHAALARSAGNEAAQIKLAAESTAAELQQSLQQEREKAAALAQDLATARKEIDTHAALARSAGDEAAQIKLAAESAAAELRRSLQQERDKTAALAKDLATARLEVDTQAALARDAGDEAAQIRQAAEGAAAELRRFLQQEHEKAEALARDLATARLEVETQAALARDAGDEAAQIKQASGGTAADLRQSLQQEREKAEALAKDLATARREIDAHAKLSAKAADEATQMKQVATELRQSLQRERDRAEALARDIEFARRATDRRTALEPAANGQVTRVETAAAEQPATAAPQGGLDVIRLLARASTLLGQGSIGAARAVLERAAEAGSARASFALAETYDPLVLSRWGTYGTRGDATKARELYAKAHVGGIAEAKDRINALRQ
jgi:hypothetical protein